MKTNLAELNNLKHLLSAEAFDTYLGELLKAAHVQRRKDVAKMQKPKPVKRATAKKSGK